MANYIKLACVVLMCIAVVGSHTARALTCGQVNTSLLPCLGYLQNGGSVPPRCCAGVRSIASNARTTADRRTACNCLKSAAASVRRINQANAVSLPSKCGVNIPYKISASTNCASIK